MSLIAPLRKNHPALSSRGLPPVPAAAPQSLRCPRCHKKLSPEIGQDDNPGYVSAQVCDSCGYREECRHPSPAWSHTEIRAAIAKRNAMFAPQGVVVPMVYTADPLPLDEEHEDFEQVGDRWLSWDCRRCGKPYDDCTCLLMPDRREPEGAS